MVMAIRTPTTNLSAIFRKRAFIALFLFLCSCRAACPRWEMEKITGCHPCYHSTRLFFAAGDSISPNLELEISQTASGAKMYINIFTLVLKCDEDHSIPVRVTIDNKTMIYPGYLLQGGQRILLNDETHQSIRQALLEGRIVTIAVSRCKVDILPNLFAELYESLDIP